VCVCGKCLALVMLFLRQAGNVLFFDTILHVYVHAYVYTDTHTHTHTTHTHTTVRRSRANNHAAKHRIHTTVHQRHRHRYHEHQHKAHLHHTKSKFDHSWFHAGRRHNHVHSTTRARIASVHRCTAHGGRRDNQCGWTPL
jgi:hypothetical protein